MITPEQLASSFNAAGVDTEAKVQELLTTATLQVTRNAKMIALAAVEQEKQEAYATLEQKRLALQADVDVLTNQIKALIAT